MPSDRPDTDHPEFIGRYRILRKLGEGGMGAVFEAVQENPSRTVALKVVAGGVLLAEMRRRFELEAQVLGHLQHAAIAQVYEAGMSGDGDGARPFFAMELIRGERLDVYAASHTLDVRERLELIARIGDGIEHAHGRGVIHRDLKPDNILVDADGQPKILDFGIARATASDIRTATLQTDVGQIMGTVPYMSPEQALGDPDRIGPETDVYSLGVVAYQLLTGALPYPSDDRNLIEALRVVREEDPQPASTVDRKLAGDVETILVKALEKDVARRYRSAAELTADIRRFLADEPILARPPSARYQLAKFARRNRALVGGLAGVFLALVVGLIGTTWGIIEARAEARRANLVSGFLQEIVATVNPAVAQGADTTLMKAVLDETAARIDEELAGAPVAEAEIRTAMLHSYVGIGAFEEALDQARGALEIRRRMHPPHHEDVLDLRRYEAICLLELDRLDESEALLDELLLVAERHYGPGHELTDDVAGELATLYLARGAWQEAADAFEPLLARERERSGPDADATLVAINRLGVACLYLDRYDEAEALLTESLEGWRRVHGEAHPEAIKAVQNLAGLFSARGRHEQAEALCREALRGMLEVLDASHPQTCSVRRLLAGTLLGMDRTAEAIEILETAARHAKPDSDVGLDLRKDLASAYHEAGRTEEAIEMAEDAVASTVRVFGPEHLWAMTAKNRLATILEDVGETDRAFALRREVIDVMLRVHGEEHPHTLLFMNDLAVAYHADGRYDEADDLTRRVLAVRRRTLGDEHRSTLQSVFTLATICTKTDCHAESIPLFVEMLTGWAEIYGEEDRYVGMSADRARSSLSLVAEIGEHLDPIRALVAYDERNLEPDDVRYGADLAALAVAARQRGEPAAAEPARARARAVLETALEADHTTPTWRGRAEEWLDRLGSDRTRADSE